MTDDQKKSPLDILEDVLQDAKGAAADTKAQVAEKAAAEVLAQEQAQLDASGEQKKAEAATRIKAELAKMQGISQTPAELSRQAQEQAKSDQHQQEESSKEGYEIHQLDHTKV